jgi:hypothetical protein
VGRRNLLSILHPAWSQGQAQVVVGAILIWWLIIATSVTRFLLNLYQPV